MMSKVKLTVCHGALQFEMHKYGLLYWTLMQYAWRIRLKHGNNYFHAGNQTLLTIVIQFFKKVTWKEKNNVL